MERSLASSPLHLIHRPVRHSRWSNDHHSRRSGTPYAGQYGPATLTIDGRTVSNPLAATYRFKYANRGIGQVWCPWLLQWNMLVGREFRIGEHQTVEAD